MQRKPSWSSQQTASEHSIALLQSSPDDTSLKIDQPANGVGYLSGETFYKPTSVPARVDGTAPKASKLQGFI
jgi:hypothetical protein